MIRLPLVAAVLLVAGSALAEEKKATIIVPDTGTGVTVGKVDGETVLLKKTPNGTVGRIGKDTVILHSDGKGTTVGKVGNDKLLCHTDPRSGVTICK